jgi:hypothetical protein
MCEKIGVVRAPQTSEKLMLPEAKKKKVFEFPPCEAFRQNGRKDRRCWKQFFISSPPFHNTPLQPQRRSSPCCQPRFAAPQ